MHSPIHLRRRRRLLAVAAPLVATASLLAPTVVGATVGHVAPRAQPGVELTAHTGVFGPYLIVGNGPLKGFSVYAITSDTATTFGCTRVVFHGPGGGSFACTGPESDQSVEWPALTTTAAPIAGPGVEASMLHTVYRKGIGHQVVYDGHPLYLFDQGPGQITGEGWDEGSLPPWHGSWWLVNPSGYFEESNQTLTIDQLPAGQHVLSLLMIAGGGTYAFPAYSFSADTPATSACNDACARVFEPVLTTGSPGIEGTGVSGALGTITRSDGSTQVTYDGHPLYLYSLEGVARVNGRGLVATGSGDGKTVGGGTFHLVSP